MDVIFLDSEPTETERKILALRTKLVNFQSHLLTSETPRDRKIAVERIRVTQKQIKQLEEN